jgi:hypothetical protein
MALADASGLNTPIYRGNGPLDSKLTIPDHRRQSLKEVPMRILALPILAIETMSIGPAAAQTYDPAFPVCLHVYAKGANYYECSYTSLPQCRASASGRAAECLINPYFASARMPAGRRYRRVY